MQTRSGTPEWPDTDTCAAGAKSQSNPPCDKHGTWKPHNPASN